MVDVSRDGEKCSTFADYEDLLAGGTNIDYDGASGAIDFLDVGEPEQVFTKCMSTTLVAYKESTNSPSSRSSTSTSSSSSSTGRY